MRCHYTHTHIHMYPPGLRLIDAEIACTALQQNGKWKAKLEWSPEQSGQSSLSLCLSALHLACGLLSCNDD